jgi:toxin ParE1/3/4
LDWTLDAVPSVQRDLTAIKQFVTQSAQAKGEPFDRARLMGTARIDAILLSARSLTKAPRQGTLRPDLGPNIRHVTKDRAVIYFELIETSQTLLILAIFYGGQDHDSRILARLLNPDQE